MTTHVVKIKKSHEKQSETRTRKQVASHPKGSQKAGRSGLRTREQRLELLYGPGFIDSGSGLPYSRCVG